MQFWLYSIIFCVIIIQNTKGGKMAIFVFIKNNLTEFISIAISIASIIVCLFKALKSGKAKSIVEILAVLPELCIKAEQMFSGEKQGANKLQFVVNELRIYCLEHHYSITSAQLTQYVNEYIASTKKVNSPNNDDCVEDIKNNDAIVEII